MTAFFCDLHVHSCLSPCGDDDMTPANIAGMASINGLGIVALTDHNSSKNCPAFFEAAKRYGIVPVAGMELTTAEDIHLICLFRTLEDALSFDEYVSGLRPKIRNKPAIFGHQHIRNAADEITGEEEYLLLNACSLYLDDTYREVLRRGGAAYPAHIDRPSNGIVETLGVFPDEPPFTAYELNDGANDAEYKRRFPRLERLRKVVSSDAHVLWNLAEANFAIELDDEPYSSALIRNRLIDALLGKDGRAAAETAASPEGGANDG